MTTVNVTSIPFTTTKNLELPPPQEQMRVGNYVMDWTKGNEYAFDLKYLQFEGKGLDPQGMEVDNSTNPDPVTVTIPNALNWSRTIAPFSRRTFMVPAVAQLQFTVTCGVGAGSSTIYLYGYPVMPDSETAGGGGAYVSDNADAIAPVTTPTFLATLSRIMGYDGANWDRVRLALENADAIVPNATAVLETLSRLSGYNGASFDRLRALADSADAQAPATLGALLTLARLEGYNGANFDRIRALSDGADAQAPVTLGALLALSRAQVFDGTNWNRKREATVFATALVTAAGSTALYTPAAGLYYRLLGYSMELTENASLAAAGNFTAQFYDAAAAIPVGHTWYLPAAAVAGQGTDPISPLAMGQGFLSGAAANPLNINLSAALGTGALRVNVALAVGANA